MSKHQKTVEILEDRELSKRIFDYHDLFGLKPTERKFGLSRHVIETIINFVEAHKQ